MEAKKILNKVVQQFGTDKLLPSDFLHWKWTTQIAVLQFSSLSGHQNQEKPR